MREQTRSTRSPEHDLWLQLTPLVRGLEQTHGTYWLTRLDGARMALWRNRYDEWGWAMYDEHGQMYDDGMAHLDPYQASPATQVLQHVLAWAEQGRPR